MQKECACKSIHDNAKSERKRF